MRSRAIDDRFFTPSSFLIIVGRNHRMTRFFADDSTAVIIEKYRMPSGSIPTSGYCLPATMYICRAASGRLCNENIVLKTEKNFVGIMSTGLHEMQGEVLPNLWYPLLQPTPRISFMLRPLLSFFS